MAKKMKEIKVVVDETLLGKLQKQAKREKIWTLGTLCRAIIERWLEAHGA